VLWFHASEADTFAASELLFGNSNRRLPVVTTEDVFAADVFAADVFAAVAEVVFARVVFGPAVWFAV